MFDPSMLTILVTPLISAALVALFLRRQGNLAAGVSVAAAGILCVLSLQLIFGNGAESIAYKWIEIGSLRIDMGFLWNHETATMLFVVAFVGFWIHVFSLGYMNDDESKARYFGGLSIFMFSMLGIVFADNLFMIFIFWELVGFSSYMLIAHYHKTYEASNACKKAFIVNRIGDLGFVLGILVTYWSLGTASLEELQTIATQHPDKVTTAIGLLLMCGFLGKSAQFPLHVWLPDAMAGPTPVSALIHAATMVAAGIYFLIRVQFLITADVLNTIAWLGATMALYAGICALTQKDIKKIPPIPHCPNSDLCPQPSDLATLYSSSILPLHAFLKHHVSRLGSGYMDVITNKIYLRWGCLNVAITTLLSALSTCHFRVPIPKWFL